MIFLGCPYPIVKTPRGLLPSQNGVNQIKSDLLILLLTYPGERVFLPTYGTPLKDLIFDPNDATVAAKAEAMIIASINAWEPRITVNSIEISNGSSDVTLNSLDNGQNSERILGIKISFFDPENIKSVQELVLQVPLSGGTT